MYYRREEMEYKIPINKENYCKAMLMILNFQFNLSKFEIDIMAVLLSNGITHVNTDARDLLRKVMDKGKFNINNYINKLRNKGILLPTSIDRTLLINPTIIDIIKDKEVSFKFTIND